MAGTLTRSRRLLDACAPVMDRALGMRFVEEVRTGTIGDQVYADYLQIEAAFVETAARLHGLAVWDAPGWTAMERNAAAVHALTTEQADYFRAARAAWGCRPRPGVAAPVLSEYALSAAREGGYPAVMTVLFAAESLYLTWCTRAHEEGTVPPGPIADWVAMHADTAFQNGVKALAAEVDGLPASDEQLAAWFTGMLEAEIAFHDAVYEDEAR
ncbi:TenA family protein [Actinomadura barringtoniae]|uniref:TenA family protein n=1 Tax=Actinomadura barringtoniae TaxID=1427535 RepID=A0A939P8M0_9ACTN|nr:TenA family protein [Actinomadura barringtoniae]MBO2447765.1 TenA family protein [Actinomadura barringtoniae]